jgi:ribonuclease HI
MNKRKKAQWYGVRTGRSGPGVYSNWGDCSAEVSAFKGAVFKGRFKSEEDAKAWVNMTENVTVIVGGCDTAKRARIEKQQQQPPEYQQWDEITVYTDGNDFKHVQDRADSPIGYGIYVRHGDNDYGLSQRVNASFMQRFFGMHPKMAKGISNSTMEFCAVAEVIHLCSTCEPRGEGEKRRVVKIYTDYDGPRNWINGTWQAKAA